jgi:tRNA-modifying protein YgfZ
MAEAYFVMLENRGILAVSGPDRRSFLQGLVTNDVDKVTPTAARYAALLTAQGKYLHDFIITDAGESLLLDAEADRLADLKGRLSLYRLRAKASLEERPDLCVAAMFGTGALEALDLPPESGACRPYDRGLVFVDPRLTALGARAILPRGTPASALLDIGLTQACVDAYDRLRISLGIPDGSRDFVIEKSILLEAGFDELNGVDWQKGCYVGQELTARTKYRGLIKKRLLPVAIHGPAPSPGTSVIADGREVGEMRSSRDGWGLALLRMDDVRAGKEFVSGDAAITPAPPEWIRL